MKIVISGSREGFNYKDLRDFIYANIPLSNIDEIVAGGARGVDTYAKIFAKRHNIKYTEFIPDWDGLGKKAGHLRNIEMAEYVKGYGILLALVYNDSNGTSQMISYCKKKGIKSYVLRKYSIDFS